MVGATAIIGSASGSVKSYALNGKAETSVVPLGQEVQDQLVDAGVDSTDGGLSVFFTATLGEAGVPLSLDNAQLIYAAGPNATLSYHASRRGGSQVDFVNVPSVPS